MGDIVRRGMVVSAGQLIRASHPGRQRQKANRPQRPTEKDQDATSINKATKTPATPTMAPPTDCAMKRLGDPPDRYRPGPPTRSAGGTRRPMTLAQAGPTQREMSSGR